jgi:putative oxidoreductase
MFYNFLFPQRFRGPGVSLLLLVVRVVFGILFFVHGLDKLVNFNTLVQSYPSAFGFGSYMTLMVSIFCEFCCSLFLISGLLVRLMTIPMIIAMGVAFFDVHDAMMPEGELALIYFIIFIMLFLTGPGRYSIDYLIDKRFKKDKQVVE